MADAALDVPPPWARAADRILERGWRTLLTLVPADRIRVLQIGDLRLDRDGRERGR